MKLALFSPYGSFHREGGLMYLVANYLSKQGGDVIQLRCDGALPACGRDKQQATRHPFSCLQCIADQKMISEWAGIKSRDLSTYILPDDVVKSAQWISSVGGADLVRMEFRGERLWEVCKQEFLARHPELTAEKVTAAQEQDLRHLYVGYVHAVVSSERFLTSWKPTLSFIPSSSDPICQAYLAQVRRVGGDGAIFSLLPGEEVIAVESLSTGSRYTTTLVLPEVSEMRSDPRTWAPELTAIVNEMLSFLGHGADLIPE